MASNYARLLAARPAHVIEAELDRLQEIITTAQQMVDPSSPLSAVLFLSPEERKRYPTFASKQDSDQAYLNRVLQGQGA